MGKFDNLLYDCKVQLDEALDGEPRPEDIIDPDDESKTFQASGFNYYSKYNPEHKESEDIHNKKAELVNQLISFDNKYRTILFMYRKYDPDVAKIEKEFYLMYNSVSEKI